MDDQELNEPQNRVALLKGNHGSSDQQLQFNKHDSVMREAVH